MMPQFSLAILAVCSLLTNQASSFVVVPSPPRAAKVIRSGTQTTLLPPNVRIGTRRVSTKYVRTCHEMLPARNIFWALSIPTWALFNSVKIIKQGDVAIVERLGKYNKRLEPGFHLTIPIIDRISTTFTNREQVFDIPPQRCITLDNAPLKADAVVYWKIVNPEKALYSVVDLNLAIQNLVLTQLRSEIGKLTLDATFSARDQINTVLLKDLDIATDPWGVKITRVEVRDIIPNAEIMAAMEMQMAAERTKRAVVIKSEGERAMAVNKAEGLAQARIIDAKASAESVRLEAEAEATRLQLEAEGAAKSLLVLTDCLGSSEAAAKFQLSREYIEAQNALARSSNAKVILSSDTTSSDPLVKALSIYSS